MTVDLGTTRALEDWPLPILVTGERLREAVRSGTFIERGDLASVEGVKYDFHIGSLVLKAAFGQTVDGICSTRLEHGRTT